MFTVYLTPGRKIFISDSEGYLRNQNDLRNERNKVVYDPQDNQLKVVSQSSHSRHSQIPYDKSPTPVFKVRKKLEMDFNTLNAAVRKRRSDLDQSWAEYFSIGHLITPYTTENKPVPPEIRKEAEARLELLAENKPEELVDIIFHNK